MSHFCTDAEPKGCGRTQDSADLWTAIREMMRLISPDDEVPVDRRLEQLGLCVLRDIITAQHDQIAVQRSHIALLTAHTANQQLTLDRLQSDVGLLMAAVDMRPHLIGGRLPAKSDIAQLKVQIFRSPDLPLNERKARQRPNGRFAYPCGSTGCGRLRRSRVSNCIPANSSRIRSPALQVRYRTAREILRNGSQIAMTKDCWLGCCARKLAAKEHRISVTSFASWAST